MAVLVEGGGEGNKRSQFFFNYIIIHLFLFHTKSSEMQRRLFASASDFPSRDRCHGTADLKWWEVQTGCCLKRLEVDNDLSPKNLDKLV